MTRVYDDNGVVRPVTVILANPNTITQIKSPDKHGYEAVQVGAGATTEKRVGKPLAGHFKKAGVEPQQKLMEWRTTAEGVNVGDQIGVTQFKEGEYVDVVGVSKGKGFQGVMKRYGFHGQPDSHGSKMHRRPGSVGAGSTPGRTWKLQKMPGHTGNRRVTVQNLRVVQVREADNVLLISGAVPGPNGSYVVVRTATKGQKAERKAEAPKKMLNPIKAGKKGK